MKNLLIISLSLVFLISCEVAQSKNIYSPPTNKTKPIENFFYYSDLNSLEIIKLLEREKKHMQYGQEMNLIV